MQMLKGFLPGTQEAALSSSQSREIDEKMEMDDPEKAMATVAQLIEQLHAKTSSPQSPRLTEPIGDVIGALAYALMVFKQPESLEKIFDPTVIESILVKLLKPRDAKLIQERILEAMASLYGNSSLSCSLDDAEAKRVLIALITMASSDVREHLIICLSQLSHEKVGIWEAVGKREGIQLFISFLGLSSEQHQEYAVEMLEILTAEVDDSKWAVTAAGGIPPLVQLLETGSQ